MSGRAALRAVNVFDTHVHAVRITYPATDGDLLDLETIALMSIANAANRYEPRPLIADEAVTAHANRDSEAESSHFTLTRAGSHATCEGILAALSGADSSLPVLTAHMRFCSSKRGHTNLQVLTYHSPDGGDVLIRFSRKSEFLLADGSLVSNTGTYTVSFRASAEYLSQDEWFLDVVHLLGRESDHAVRHVAQQLRQLDIQESPQQWMEPRLPAYDVFVSSATEQASDFQSKSCMVCTGEFDTVARVALVPRCHAEHVICETCLLWWCRSHIEDGPPMATCVHCRQPYFNDQEVEMLKFGTDDQGVYSIDGLQGPSNRRYTAYESFERSCADLDKTLAQNNPDETVFDAELTCEVLKHILKGAELESAASTPLKLQPVRCYETEVLLNYLESALRRHDGERFRVNQVYHLILNSLKAAFSRYFVTSDRQIDQPWPASAIKRPGYPEFLSRTLSRALQFCYLRKCTVDGHPDHMHTHGERAYYKPRSE